MPRPKSNNPKDIQYRLRMDEATAERLEYICRKSGMCKAFILRELINRAFSDIIWMEGKEEE